jgi:ubiquinone/menaquinone biosynthesis C-methylase UbiE
MQQVQQAEGQLPSDIQARMALLQMSNGYWVSQALYAAAKLGIADLLKDGAKHCDELAEATSTHPRSLYRLLRGLASVGVFAEQAPQVFSLTPIASGLRTDIPGSMRSSVLLAGEEYYKAWGNILYSLETGKSAFEQTQGMPAFQYYAAHPKSSKIFDQAMTNISDAIKPAIAHGYNFSGIRKLVDVGGGNGSLIAAILRANPSLKGVLFDQTAAIATASTVLAEVSDRCELVAGDFFEALPSNADAYLLKYVLHNWDDEHAIAILKNCHRAMQADGKLLVVEQVIPAGNEPFFGKLIDLHMLVNFSGGCERTEQEYRDLFAVAGFELSRVVPTRSNVSVLEGRKMN